MLLMMMMVMTTMMMMLRMYESNRRKNRWNPKSYSINTYIFFIKSSVIQIDFVDFLPSTNQIISSQIKYYIIKSVLKIKRQKLSIPLVMFANKKKNWKRILFHWIKIENEKINTLNLIDFFSSFIVCIYSRLLACHIKTNKCDKYNEQRASQSCVFYTILV